ncbi:spermine oxidase-like [Anopheles ziemanni]|uniref:spermine oxidase-like n=1 Tax=Anopheles coustani TaxID=139045 RepID=UPI0026593120|nr:spermine oxidase-like [Anopheles coustani]XP_058177930.1 spermine oxidase-like [Anopheles ziemanni]
MIILLTITVSKVRAVATGENPRIIVVGAGAAGIAAASRLYQNGLKNIAILEASPRLGGRIRTTPFGSGSGIVELGAQWCHGEQGNVVYQLAKVYPGLLKSSIIADEDAVLIRSSGVRVPEEVAERLQTMAEEIIESEERDNFSGSLGEFFTQQYWQRLQTDPAFSDINRELAEQFLVYYHNYERGYTAYDSWYEVAASETDGYVEPAGNQDIAWNGTKGFSTIFDIVSGNFPHSVTTTRTPVPLDKLITYGKFVSNIQWNGTPNENVLITSEDGSRYEADHVIVTVSLGVLKENYRTMFTPALPTINQNAITGLYFGTVNKIFVLFDAPIPDDFPNTVHLLWFDSDLQALRLSEHAWAEAISTFFRIDNQPNVLMAWMNGAEGRTAELLSDETVRAGVLHLLKIFTKDITFGNVNKVLRKWSSERLFRGSYSSRSITTEQLNTGAQNLATPLVNAGNEPVVLFAGEATNRVHYSTVHGAIDSGFREADRLLQHYS